MSTGRWWSRFARLGVPGSVWSLRWGSFPVSITMSAQGGIRLHAFWMGGLAPFKGIFSARNLIRRSGLASI